MAEVVDLSDEVNNFLLFCFVSEFTYLIFFYRLLLLFPWKILKAVAMMYLFVCLETLMSQWKVRNPLARKRGKRKGLILLFSLLDTNKCEWVEITDTHILCGCSETNVVSILPNRGCDDDNGLEVWQIVLIALGAATLPCCCCCLLLAALWRRRKQKKKEKENPDIIKNEDL